MVPAAPADMTPPADATAFLSAAGWGGAAILPLAGDASFRRYFRVVDRQRTAVLMDAPPPEEDTGPFLSIAQHLSANGFAAPAIIAADRPRGLVLLQDLGDARLRDHLERHPEEERPLYEAAVDLLCDLRRVDASGLPLYDAEVYLREAALLPEWFAPLAGLAVDGQAYAARFAEALSPLLRPGRLVLVLRDYHSENLMLLDGGRLGLLDFQDALVGHPAYDLVSLLQDARRDVAPALEEAMVERYLARTGDDPDRFRADYAALGAQRNAKIVGIFARLARRDGKPRYLSLLPRVWRYLERDLAHPRLAALADWFAANVPVEARTADHRRG